MFGKSELKSSHEALVLVLRSKCIFKATSTRHRRSWHIPRMPEKKHWMVR